ncbi:hypothetical protein S245_069594, partial [Arachis hypogaea]
FGIDGLSIGPILLTGFITTIATLAAQPVTREFRLFHFLMLSMYNASTSLGQRNLKKRIAYSSVSHMSFIIIGIGSISDTGLNGAILQIISHGFISAALFFLAKTGYDRLHLLYLDQMGGMPIPMPKIFTVFSILSMASLALPGMS